jgi:hypothetical protein
MKVEFLLCLAIALLSILIEQTHTQSTKSQDKDIPIGLFYCDDEEFKRTEEIVTALNSQFKNSRYKFHLKGLKLNKIDNMITLSTLVCQNLINSNSIFTALVANTSCVENNSNTNNSFSENDDYILTKTTISSTCGFYQIPVIDLNSQDAVYSDKVQIIHSSFDFET